MDKMIKFLFWGRLFIVNWILLFYMTQIYSKGRVILILIRETKNIVWISLIYINGTTLIILTGILVIHDCFHLSSKLFLQFFSTVQNFIILAIRLYNLLLCIVIITIDHGVWLMKIYQTR